VTFWTPENLRASCAGTWLLRPSSGVAASAIAGLSTDSRAVKPRQAFLALRGESFDAHAFLPQVIAAGSPLLIVHDDAAATAAEPGARRAGAGIIRVPDTAKALLRLAGAYRRTLENTKVVAVGGSNGKTTATRLIHAVLASSLRGTASARSFNNAVGVPLTILSASPTDQFLICEVGTNAPGEIAQLASIVEPDIAVITSIGREHLEGFGSIQGVAREEASLLRFLREGGSGLAVVTADTPVEAPLTEYLRTVPHVVRFGFAPDADLRASEVSHTLAPSAEEGGMPTVALRFRINERTACTLPLLGEHNACNALAAFAVGRRFGLDPERIVAALATARGPEMRLQPVTVPAGGGGSIHCINDAYNANPDSMLAALHTLADVAESLGGGPGSSVARVVVVLGDMMELGAAAEAGHREIAERLRDMPGVDAVVLVGEQMDRWARPVLVGPGSVRRVLSEPEADAAAFDRIAAALRPGDLVLLKGSRRVRLERTIDALRRRFPAPAGTSPAAPPAACST
jgi:UDP-N-acetylmuramoyl-tripeptide--D-alanyl-D-alanine ligase